ncbi:DUF1707 domain-containing protein [Streptomyces sp. TRM43335]|uniref:DUF1707 domain-containing protein n=1 Tax=Streptomyces taklimakanensis TaxID=2569853 RepID=A0A6G2BFG3_9ACTN|nr:DUF1707 domain-containing protein [Streptomyces taklimakanensis]MTE20642.1 DUF1707 domain-containing protein [Streptomyces taklimakanensis]
MTDLPAHRPGSELRAGHADREEVAERLREAAGDGRIDLEELEERLEKALTAKTYGELDALTADLPAPGTPGRPAPSAPPSGEPLVLKTVAGDIRRTGYWVVPEKIVAKNTLGQIKLDFTRAECRHREVHLEIDAGMGEVRIVVPRGWSVHTDGLSTGLGSVRNRATEPPAPGTPVLRITGSAKAGTVVVRYPFRRPGRRADG